MKNNQNNDTYTLYIVPMFNYNNSFTKLVYFKSTVTNT